MKKRPKILKLFATYLFCLALLSTLACGAKKEPEPTEDPAATFLAPGRQTITFRVLNGRDRPVPGARISLAPFAGRVASPGPHITDRKGELTVDWLPQGTNRSPQMRDTIITYSTKLNYKVKAKGHFSGEGRIESESQARIMASKELQSMNKKADLSPIYEIVVIRGESELWAGEFSKAPKDHPLKRRLTAYYDELSPVASHLGAKFSWPAFKLDKGTLSLIFDWTGVTWSGLAPAPLKAKVTLNSGMPLIIAAAEDLLPIDGVNQMALVFISQYKPPDDPHAIPKEVQIKLQGPVESLIKLVAGTMSVDEFLNLHPATLDQG